MTKGVHLWLELEICPHRCHTNLCWTENQLLTPNCDLDLEFRGIKIPRCASSHAKVFSYSVIWLIRTSNFGVMTNTSFGLQSSGQGHIHTPPLPSTTPLCDGVIERLTNDPCIEEENV